MTDDGSVFGETGNAAVTGHGHAFYFHEGIGMVPLDNMIAGGLDHSHWSYLERVSAVSSNGEWVVGTGMTTAGTEEAFLLQLVPEPSTLSLLSLAVVPQFCRRRTQRLR